MLFLKAGVQIAGMHPELALAVIATRRQEDPSAGKPVNRRQPAAWVGALWWRILDS
jgi:hypothetical protein